MQKNIFRLLLFFGLLLFFAGCSTKNKAQETTHVKIGVVGDSNEVWEPIIKELKKDNITVELVKFSDYVKPNEALDNGDIDLNAFQGYILMDDFNKIHGKHLTAIGETVLNPIGLYSEKYKEAEDIPEGAEITIANDPVNAARGLQLLQTAGLITLGNKKGYLPSQKDILENPKNIKITELEAAQTARSLQDVDASVINTFMALDAGLIPKQDAIFLEPVNEDSKPYYNIIVARKEDKDDPTYKKIVAAYQTDGSKKIIEELYKGSVLPLWD